MRFRPAFACLGVAAAVMLTASAAHAFTVENKDAAGQYAVPKFDLEEQAKNFRKEGSASGSGAAFNDKGMFETPLGNGKLQFGITQGSASNFGSVFSPGLGPSDGLRASRQEFDRRLAPPTSMEFNGVR